MGAKLQAICSQCVVGRYLGAVELPIESYEPSVLLDLGQAIGPVLRIDMHMARETRGRFSRICVQVNLKNSPIKIIKIGGIEQPVQYEGINSLCFSYGRVGHKVDGCPYMARATCKDGEDKVEEDNSTVIDRSTPIEETYGPWVLVTWKTQAVRKGYKDPANPFNLACLNNQRRGPNPLSILEAHQTLGLTHQASWIELDIPTHKDQALREGEEAMTSKDSKLVPSQVPLREISNEPTLSKGNMKDLVASVSLKVSKAILKRIDPKLKPSRMGAKGGPNPSTNQEEVLVNQVIESDASP